MRRKRLASLALAAVMTASVVLAGCGQGENNTGAGKQRHGAGSSRHGKRDRSRYGSRSFPGSCSCSIP